jgi:hypothetical protein
MHKERKEAAGILMHLSEHYILFGISDVYISDLFQKQCGFWISVQFVYSFLWNFFPDLF